MMTGEKKLINWVKRVLIANIINGIGFQQKSHYDFPVVEPINTYLTELAHLEGI